MSGGELCELPVLAGNAGPGGFGRQNSGAQEDTAVNLEKNNSSERQPTVFC